MLGCATTTAAPNDGPVLYRFAVTYTPCGPRGCASDSTTLYESGVLERAHSDAPTTREELTEEKMAAIRAAIRGDAKRLFREGPIGPSPQPNDASGSCEVWLDGKHARFGLGSPECAELGRWIGG